MAEKEPRQKVLDRIKERRIAARKKFRRRLIKVGAALSALVVMFAILYPYLQVVWQTRKARAGDPETRKAALRWLAEKKAGSAIHVFVEALDRSRGESYLALDALREFKDPSIIPQLLEIWEDPSDQTHAYAKYNALQLVAELGDKSLMDHFIKVRVLLSARGWEAAWDFLDKYADEETAEKLLNMLNSGDRDQELAAAMALNCIRKKPFIKNNREIKNTLASKISSPDAQVRQEALRALHEIADGNQFPALMEALNDKDWRVCKLAAMVIGDMKREVAARALPRLLEKLLDPDGDICAEATRALIKIGANQAVSRLVEIVSDGKNDSFSRQNAIEVLKTTGDAQARTTITAALRDPEPEVARAAAMALIRVGNKDSVKPLAQTLDKARSQKLRKMAAYAIGMLGGVEAGGALVNALREGDCELSKIAGAAFLRAGGRKFTPELAQVFRNHDNLPTARREALLVLSKFRTATSLELAIGALADEAFEVREEAGNAALQLTADLLQKGRPDFAAAKALLVEVADAMIQKDVAAKLHGNLDKVESLDKMNSLVLAAMRRLNKENNLDHDELEKALEEAKAICWTSLLRQELAGLGLSDAQVAEAARALKEYVETSHVPEVPPMATQRKKAAQLRKMFRLGKQ